MTTLDEFMAVKANSYMAVVDTWRPQTTQFKEAYDDYKRWAGAPAGTEWTGRTANAAYERAATDCHGSDNADDAAEDAVTLASATITYEVVPPLTGGQNLVERALVQKDRVSIDQSFNMEYHPAEGESDESIARNREHVKDSERQIKEYVAKWEKGCQTLKGQAEAAAQKITGCINPKTALVDGRKVLRDAAAPKPGDGPATVTATSGKPHGYVAALQGQATETPDGATKPVSAETVADYKKWYPKDVSVGDKNVDPSKLGGIGSIPGARDTASGREPPAKLAPALQAKDVPAFKEMTRETLTRMGVPADQIEAQVNKAVENAQNPHLVRTDVPSASQSEHVSRDFGEQFNRFTNGISDSATKTVDGQIEQAKILTGQAGPGAPGVAEAWKQVGLGAVQQAHELTTDPLAAPKMGIEQAKDFYNNPSEFIGKNIIHGTEALATGAIGGEAAAGARGLLGDLTSTEGRALTHGLDDATPGHHPTPISDHHTPVGDQSVGNGHSASNGAAHSVGPGLSDSPVAGHDFGLTPSNAFEHVLNPADDLARLHQGGVPSHITDGYDPLAGRRVDQFQQEFTVPRSDGSLRWDWDNQAPNSGFAGSPTVTDHLPKDYAFDRLGWEKGAFMADDGAPLATRSMPPGVASQYNQYVGTGQRIPEDLNWEVRHGPAAPAFGQPGGANQWVVIDKTTGNEVPVKDLLDEGLLAPTKGNR